MMTKEEKSRLKELNKKIKDYNKKYKPCPGFGTCPALTDAEFSEFTQLSFMEIDDIREKEKKKAMKPATKKTTEIEYGSRDYFYKKASEWMNPNGKIIQSGDEIQFIDGDTVILAWSESRGYKEYYTKD